MKPRLLSCYLSREWLHVSTGTVYAGNNWPRLANVLRASARRHAPGWDVQVEEHRADREAAMAGDRLTWQEAANTQKLRWWTRQVMDAPDGALLLLCDTDVFITGSLDAVWDQSFDVAYTVRPEGCRIPFNAGVVFVRVSAAAQWFMGDWCQKNDRLARSHALRQGLRPRYAGINQSALALALLEPGPANVLALPCHEWNCEDSTWERFGQATRIVHLKGALRRDVLLTGVASKAHLAPIVEMWRSFEAGR